ncbi:hypothetical protein K7W42_06710 [Deinococcus sp. HMF7604]|uniref:DoxX family protein n=1 Tax=Deinococcus betulae TaxID=2873312 RepID=UPI001CCE97A8|nr:hypothetical protein [Deinococcus betulae]MBZ9750549.1 hypothetical protein [Deinococcus betulae]
MTPTPPASSGRRHAGRLLLGSFLVLAGVGHLTFARRGFQAQVPDGLPVTKDTTVLASGVVEIALGAALLAPLAPPTRRALGWGLAAFFVAVFPGNISQFVHHRSALGMDTDTKRAARLPFQPVLVLWALWSTGAWPKERR